MRILVRLVLMSYVLALFCGLGYWWYVWRMHDGMPPPDEDLGRWAIAHPWAFAFSLNLITAQITYPVFWLLTRRMTWGGFWGVLRMAHAILVGSAVLLLLILLLATPDVSGFKN